MSIAPLRGLVLCSLSLLTAGLSAQSPLLRVQPTARPGQPISTLLLAGPSLPFATFVDREGSGSTFLDEPLWLSLTSSLFLLDAGTLDPIGVRTLAFATPPAPGLAGVPVYFQSFVLDAAAPNGLFRSSNGQSVVLHGTPFTITFAFNDPVAEGVTGDYDASVRERVMAAPVRRRTATVEPPQGIVYSAGLATPLVTTNARLQHVYRAVDLGARGEPEYVTALRWKPFGAVTADSFARVHISMSHSLVVPDYTIDPFSQLPVYPGSGLRANFASNVKPQETAVVVHDGPYVIRPSDVRPDRYLPWPALQRPFLYDGFDSLLVDYRVVAGPTTLGANGFQVRLMVLSDGRPDTRAYAPGFRGGPIDPFAVTTAAMGDNAYYETQLELTAVTSRAITPFVANPARRVSDAWVTGDFPPGTRVAVEYEGAPSATGVGGTGFLAFPGIASGYPFVRVRLVLSCDPISGARPSVDTLVIPVD